MSKIAKIWWLWIPIAFMAVQMVLEVTLSAQTLGALHSEQGPHELLQFIIIALAFIVAAVNTRKALKSGAKWLAAWCGLATICCLYVAGEEISWGQHILEWSTPEYWHALNDQGETNLHNTSSWLDQKPRLMLEIGVIVGGLIIPALAKWKPSVLPEKFTVIYPPAILSVTAFIAIGSKLLEKMSEALNIVLFERVSEVEELYLFYFVLLYLIVLSQRITKTPD